MNHGTKNQWHYVLFGALTLVLVVLFWLGASTTEWRTGRRIFPWSAYSLCGDSKPVALPQTVRVGLYEEFPVPWRLDKLKQIDFPVELAIAAPSRAEFLKLREEISRTYPQIREVYFWPVLSRDEGYYTGTWSNADGIRRVAVEAEGLPVLWDLEMPIGKTELGFRDWWRNRDFLDRWLRDRTAPVALWRSNVSMGLNPLFLHLVSMHFDPSEYPAVSLHLDLYMTGDGLASDLTARIMRCGVERYGGRFIPSLGVLNDGEGPEHIFVPLATLRRNLQLARQSGVSQVWLFGVNGLNDEYLQVLHETLPLEAGAMP